jgi:hypothetical protein
VSSRQERAPRVCQLIAQLEVGNRSLKIAVTDASFELRHENPTITLESDATVQKQARLALPERSA